MNKSRSLIGGAIALYFVIALEVLMMISPFAALFYTAFSPVLLFFAQWSTCACAWANTPGRGSGLPMVSGMRVTSPTA